MKPLIWLGSVITCIFIVTHLYAATVPFDGTVFKGRIAFSSDGNFNDEDDWGAFPVAVAMLDAFGVKDHLVHVDYNNILPQNDERFYQEMTTSVLGAAKRYRLPQSIMYDCQKDLDGAVESIKQAINASSIDNPLFFILAGPMEVPFLGIEQSDPEKRKFVYCISHSGWNDGYSKQDHKLFTHNKRDVIPSGINWIQIRDGNRNLAHPGGVGKKSTPEQWAKYQWLQDSSDPNLNWIYTRLEAEQRADISDSCMTYFLLTGDEDADLPKLIQLLENRIPPKPVPFRKQIRLEAENFRTLENMEVEFKNDRKASKRISVKLNQNNEGWIRTNYDELFSVDSGIYEVDIRYGSIPDGQIQMALFINGKQQGDSWKAELGSEPYLTHTIKNVKINHHDEIAVSIKNENNEMAKIDFVELNYQK